MAETAKVGIIACSGEEIPAGTISRLATRRVLELLRPQSTVTLCLPLFLAGEQQERRFAQQHPTITVDGCSKCCAKRGTEQYSAQVAASLVVTDIVGDAIAGCHRSARDFDGSDMQAVWAVAERIAAEVDALAGAASPVETTAPAACACACGSPQPGGSLKLSSRTVDIPGLPLIFDQLHNRGLSPADSCADELLATVRIYHAIEPGEESEYRWPLLEAYRAYCRQHSVTTQA